MAGIALAILPVTGCSGDAAPDVPEGMDLGTVSISEYADVTATLDFDTGTVQLPLDRYRLSEPQNDAVIDNALDTLASECLVKAGFTPLSFTPVVARQQNEDRLFGRWSVSLAEKYGTGLDPSEKSSLIDTSAQGDDYTAKYGECYDAAKDTVADHIEALTDPGMGYKISANAHAQVLKDDEGIAAIEKSLKCMEDRGISVQRDDGAGPSGDYRNQPREEQVRVATQAARCRVDTGAIQTLYDLDARYQSAYIAQYEAQLKAQSDSVSDLIAALEKIVSGKH